MRPRLRYAALAAAAWVSIGAGAPAELAGRWVLVEQKYEKGSANLAFPEQPVHLEIERVGGGVRGRIWAGDDRAAARNWPAFVNDSGPLPVEIEKVEESPAGTVRARYRVRPSPVDDLVLAIEETYRVEEGGAALTGTMRVEFTGGESNRGGFTLHRRFEREP